MTSENKIRRYRVESLHGLWEPVEISVQKGVIIESSVHKGYEVGSNFESMRKYWEGFEGENKYKITELHDQT